MRLRNIHEPQSGVDVTTVPTEGQTQTLRRHSDPITPLRLRHVDDDGRNEEAAPDNATTDDEDYHTHKEKQVKVTQLHTPRASTMPPRRRQQPLLRRNLKRQSRRRPEPWVDYTVRATHKVDDLLGASGITSWILRQSRIYWKQARLIAKHHDDRLTKPVSKWNPAVSTKQKWYQKQGRPAKTWDDDLNIYLQPTRSNRDNHFTSDMTWLTTAEDGSKCDALESDFISSRLKQPTRPTTTFTTTTTTQPKTHDQTTSTTKAHDPNEDDTKDDDDTLLILSQLPCASEYY